MSKAPRHGRVTQPQSLLHLLSQSRVRQPPAHAGWEFLLPTGTRIVDELGRLREYRAMPLRLVQFLAIILTALALVPSGARLAALPNKTRSWPALQDRVLPNERKLLPTVWWQPTSSPRRSMLDGLSSALSFSALWQRIWRTRWCCAGWADHSATRSPHFCLLLLTWPSSSSRPAARRIRTCLRRRSTARKQARHAGRQVFSVA